MKSTSTLVGTVLAALLSAGLQAYASTYTNTLSFSGNGVDIYGTPYELSFSPANLTDGSLHYSDSYGAASAEVILSMYDAGGHAVTLDLDYSAPVLIGTETPGSSPNPYTLTYGTGDFTASDLSYIDSANPITFTAEADCYLQSAELIVTTPVSNASAPDGGSTVILLGGILTVLGLARRKVS